MYRMMHHMTARRRTMMHHAMMNRPAMYNMVHRLVMDLRHSGRGDQRAKSNQTGNQ